METTLTPELFNHGIQTEDSDIRAHVAVLAKAVYVFPTRNGIKAIDAHRPVLRSAGQNGVVGKTADGYAVNVEWIEDLRVRRLAHWPVWDNWEKNLSTTEKGRRAVQVVCEMLKRGVFPLWLNAFDDPRQSVQIKGTDIVIFARKKIQVKCDYSAGNGHPQCTGRLFLQVAERNPLRRH